MGFGVEDDFVEGEDIGGAEEEVEVFECFGLLGAPLAACSRRGKDVKGNVVD